MFDNIRLFTKANNRVQEPSSSWTSKTTIHCAFDLNLGFGSDKAVWHTGNSVKLRKLIGFYLQVNKLIDNKEAEYQFELKNNDFVYVFNWTNSNVKVYRQSCGTSHLILEKKFSYSEVIRFTKQFFTTIMKILSTYTNNEVASSIGELFFKRHNDRPYEFKIGHKVETIIGANVKTSRWGVIIDKWYHSKDKTTMYQLLVGDTILVKRYLPSDLKLIECPRK